jgi:hypothetical protein
MLLVSPYSNYQDVVILLPAAISLLNWKEQLSLRGKRIIEICLIGGYFLAAFSWQILLKTNIQVFVPFLFLVLCSILVLKNTNIPEVKLRLR